MRIFLTLLVVLTLFVSSEVKGQAVNPALGPEGLVENATREKIHVHYNSSLLFPGEYFLYSVYNLKENGEASAFSKIAYVELMGKDNTLVFRQKVKLENGRGSADFFLPTGTPSGTYKLIAYTNWMKNRDDAFFKGDVVVINPYQSNQNKLLGNPEGNESTAMSDSPVLNNQRGQGELMDLRLTKTNFGNREQVQINFNGNGADARAGRYSLSVRKIGALPAPNRVDPSRVISLGGSEKLASDKLFLPELRGQLVSGQVIPEGSTTSVENRKVALSIPSYDGYVQIALTNKEGQFFFNWDKELRDERAVLEIVGDAGDDLKIVLDRNEGVATDNLQFPKYSITPEMEEEIVQRSLYNQIENAYFSEKPDTLVPAQEEVIFPESLVDTYDLDAYTRFKEVPETFVEIIKFARVTRVQGNTVFHVTGLQGSLSMGLNPLVMVDGILVQDHAVLANYDARRIQTIKIIRDKIYLGPAIYQGAILVKTIDGDFFESYTAPNAEKVALVPPVISKRYFQQRYTAENRNSRIPDYRYQLLWKPSVEPIKDDGAVEFFTSDVDGDFEVVLEGFTASGKPVSIRKTFTVE